MKKYFTILNLLLIAAGIYFGVKAFYRTATIRLDHGPLAKGNSELSSSSEDEIRQPLTHYQPIIERNIFDTKNEEEEEKKPEVKGDDKKELEETKLKLKLWGTVSGDTKKAYAVIEDTKEKKQNLYREGDTVQNATIKKILREQLVLSVNGKDEILKMEEKKSAGGGRERGDRARERPAVKTSSASPSSEGEASQKVSLKRSEIDEAVGDINNLMKQARLRPHFKNGKPDGITITRIRPNSIFRKLRLRSGDILTGINGNEIESVDDALGFYNNLKSSSEVAVQIKRRGQLKNIDYAIDDE
ncbi:type II secretion system protein GspC [Desulfococcaceae bacterium HSG8]|nr:type II secretion system protein GspC [Desulfococcaceae bacterium HSG8]